MAQATNKTTTGIKVGNQDSVQAILAPRTDKMIATTQYPRFSECFSLANMNTLIMVPAVHLLHYQIQRKTYQGHKG